MKALLLIFFCLCAGLADAQERENVYVNTDNLILRSRPGKEYVVFVVLHAGFKLELLPYDTTITAAERAKFYAVRAYFEHDGKSRQTYGFVERKYVVRKPEEVTAKLAPYTNDDTAYLNEMAASLIYDDGRARCDPNRYNYLKYPYPKYKGGLHPFPAPPRRIYHRGPHNGCYYLNAQGGKRYVDRKYCK